VYKRQPPVRGRGLKPLASQQPGYLFPSPPVRGRGLKPVDMIIALPAKDVAPRTGAWIEKIFVVSYVRTVKGGFY